MREEKEDKVFSKIERIYGRRRYVGGNREFEECNGISRGIWKRNKERRNIKDRKEEREVESSRDRVEFRGRRVQERRVIREIYGEVVI